MTGLESNVYSIQRHLLVRGGGHLCPIRFRRKQNTITFYLLHTHTHVVVVAPVPNTGDIANLDRKAYNLISTGYGVANSSQFSNLTRQNTFCTFKLPQVSSQIGLNSLSFLAADRFNSLPADLRSAPNLLYFTSQLSLPADLRSAPNLLHFTSQLKVFIGYPRREGS